jgi:S1-C subfamily serine protease
MRRLAVIVALVAAVESVAAQPSAERAFESARGWTVYVRTSTTRPFIEDDQGSLSGAGVVIDSARGWVLTNAHVASHSYSDITVEFRGEKSLRAKPVYVDAYLDIAVIAYDPREAKSHRREAELECRALPAVGHPVGAFGHPWGFRFTGTRGITSAKTSRFGPDMLQTDAPINAGNSGGPLISLETGRVLGLNTLSIPKDKAEGLSFAVPMPFVCTVLNQLRQGKDPSPPAYLVDFAVNESRERTLVVANSRLPAGSIDLRVGDKILAVGPQGAAVQTEAELVDRLRTTLSDVNLRVNRNGNNLSLRGSWPAAPLVTQRRALWINGAMFSESEPQFSSLVGGSPALEVHYVEPGSEAGSRQIVAYDLLESANGEVVRSLEDLESIARRTAADGRDLDLVLLRLTDWITRDLFFHQLRSLRPADIEWVGPPESRAARAAATTDDTLAKSSGGQLQ